MRVVSRLLILAILVGLVPTVAAAAPCLIFVHGMQQTSETYTDWSKARNYWKNNDGQGPRDFIEAATKSFQVPYYVVGYDGTKAYWRPIAAGHVAEEIVNATSGGADDGGNRCTGATYYIVVAHSMGGAVMDFILGNSTVGDPNYNLNGGPFDQVAANVSWVVTVSGAHRGSRGADAVCGEHSNPLCNWLGPHIRECNLATQWLRSDESVQVKNFSNPPDRNIYLIGGYKWYYTTEACMPWGENDGTVQYASIFACSGSTTTGYYNSDVCGNSSKQEASGFFNIDAGYENHEEIANDGNRNERRTVPDTVYWLCGGTPCAGNVLATSSRSSGQQVGKLY